MKKLINALVFVGIVLTSASSFAYNSDPKTFINELVDDAIKSTADAPLTEK